MTRILAYILIGTIQWMPLLSADQVQTQAIREKTEKESGSITFNAPIGWRFAEAKDLPKSVKVMVIGKGINEFPPSINLGVEEYKGTLAQYLKKIKEINASKGFVWKDLGNVKTEAGVASLSQVDTKTNWGEVRMMHVILQKDQTIYIMTAAALACEFATYYKDFFAAFQSLKFT